MRPLVEAGVIVAASAAVAVAIAIPVLGGPPGTTGLVVLLAFAMALMTGIAVSGTPEGELTAHDPDREEVVRSVDGQECSRPEELEQGSGRCFGCVRLAAVTEAGVLARGEVEVPLYVCSSCLEHLEAWHAAQVGAGRTGTGFTP